MSSSLSIEKGIDRSVFRPIRPDYADFSVPPAESFNWTGIFRAVRTTSDPLYLFVFRSMLRPDANTEQLALLDEGALMAAGEAEGFRHYEPSPGLSYCLWDSTEQARAAVDTPRHRAAAAYAEKAYEQMEYTWYNLGVSAVDGQAQLVKL